MTLNFVRTTVTPGEPVTAQAWNDLVNGLFEAQQALLIATTNVQVMVTAPDSRDVDAARVIAVGAGGLRFAAAPPSNAFNPFVFARLTPGSYIIRAMAPGCADGLTGITLADNGSVVANDGTVLTGPVPLVLTHNRPRMPTVLGAPWKTAAGKLGTPISATALDASGKGVPLAGFDAAYADAPVLMQWPGPEEIVPAGATPFVVVATIVKPAVLVPTPNFVGMTVAEAQAEAAKAGLNIKLV